MAAAHPPPPGPPPEGIIISPDIVVHPVWNPTKASYDITCDLCGKKMDAGRRGHGARLLGHRLTTKCVDLQKAQGQDVVPVVPVRRDALPLRPTGPCPGAPYFWSLGSLWTTYPFQSHDSSSIRWSPVSFDSARNAIFIRSDSCLRVISAGEHACLPCQRAISSAGFLDVVARASHAEPNTPYIYLSHSQLADVTRVHLEDKRELRSQVQRLSDSNRRLRHRSDDYSRMILYISTTDIPRLRWLFAAAVKRNSSPDRMMSLLIRAAHSAYRPHGMSERELAAAYLAHAIGKPKLSFALGRAFGLVSKRTVERNLPVPRVLASIAYPDAGDINTNIAAFLSPEVLPFSQPAIDPSLLPGHILMFDGIALEPRARYCSHRDAVMGLSRETVSAVDTRASSIANVDLIRTALDEKRVRFGSEATVVSVATYTDIVNYSPVPLIVSPSDKTEKGPLLQQWIATVLECWKRHEYAIPRGPIWSMGSDGDAAYRYAKHRLCTVRALLESDALWPLLSPLLGFNRLTSADGLTTSTCDPKHIFKRFATLLRNANGIMIFDKLIRPSDILFHLATLDTLGHKAAVNLLDPADKQNVPKAVMLIERLQELKTSTPRIHLTPADVRTRLAITCFADILYLFVRPFITPTLSLSEQLTSLAAFAHAIAIFQLRHGSACFTGALYADTQATIKNIFFVTARLQLLNKKYRFFLLLEGTDRLEQVFGEARTLDHSRNFDILELSGKLSTAFLIHALFARNPELDRGHRRLEVTNCLGIDHLNPYSWTGDVRVGNVNLSEVWARGREQAMALLAPFLAGAPVNFAHVFSRADCDMLRPLGQYVGIGSQAEDQRSERVENAVTEHIQPEPAPLPFSDSTNDEFDPPHHALLDESVSRELDAAAELPPGIDLDDFFPDVVPSNGRVETGQPALSTSKTDSSKVFTTSSGKIWKSSYVAALSADRYRTVAMRTLRARGVTLEDLRPKSSLVAFEDAILNDSNVVQTGSLMGFLVRTGTSYALAVLQISAFQGPGDETKFCMSVEEFESSSKDLRTKALGQILDLQPSGDTADLWIWTGRYLAIDDDTESRYTQTRYIIHVPTAFLHPVVAQLHDRVGDTVSGAQTYIFSASHLTETVSEAWEALEPASAEVLMTIYVLPRVANESQLPYRSKTGESCFVVPRIPVHLVPEKKYTAKDQLPCRLCETEVSLDRMRDHVARHLILAAREMPDTLLTNRDPVKEHPCGFCGRSGCLTALSFTKSKSPVVHSSCGYHYERMSYAAASTSTKSGPSSNVPIACLLCPLSKSGYHRTVWKYNAAAHLLQQHGGETHPRDVMARMFIAMHIRGEEEERLGIPADKTAGFRSTSMLPDSDGVEALRTEFAPPVAKKGGVVRNRAPTTESEQATNEKRPTQRPRTSTLQGPNEN